VYGEHTHYYVDITPAGLSGTYRFATVDLTPTPGLLKPFLLFGVPQPQLDELIDDISGTPTTTRAACAAAG